MPEPEEDDKIQRVIGDLLLELTAHGCSNEQVFNVHLAIVEALMNPAGSQDHDKLQ